MNYLIERAFVPNHQHNLNKLSQHLPSCPLCGKLQMRAVVRSPMASNRTSGGTKPAGRTTDKSSFRLISGNRTCFITTSPLLSLARHHAQTPLKISTSGTKNESRWSISTRDVYNKLLSHDVIFDTQGENRWNIHISLQEVAIICLTL